MPSDPLLSVVVPVYNERATLRPVVERVLALPLRLEVIVVDDGSTDGTREVVARLGGAPRVRVFLLDRNRGKGAAVRCGLAAARGDLAVVQDADLEYDPRDLPLLVPPLLGGAADAVYGSRYARGRGGDGPIHALGNRVLTVVANLATGLRLTDMETCYKMVRTDWLRRIRIEEDHFGFEPELTCKLARLGARIVEVPISYRPRGFAAGKKIGVRDAVRAFYSIARYA